MVNVPLQAVIFVASSIELTYVCTCQPFARVPNLGLFDRTRILWNHMTSPGLRAAGPSHRESSAPEEVPAS